MKFIVKMKQIYINSKTLLISIIIFLFLFEFFSMIASKFNLLIFNSNPLYFKKEYSGTEFSYKDPKIGSWNKSNKITRHISKCFDVNYQFNNIGARDNKDYNESTFRKSIIIIGDSFPAGYGINIEKTFFKIVERTLGKNLINLSVSGTNPKDYWNRFNHFVKNDDFSEIIYFFLPQNDFISKEKDENTKDRKTKKSNYLSYKIKSYLSKYTYSFNTLASIKFLYFNKDKSNENFSYNFKNKEIIDYTYSYVERIMKIKNIKKTLIVIPTRKDFQFNGNDKSYKKLYWYEQLKKMSKLYNFMFIDVYDIFLVDEQYKYYHECDGHWNEFGNKIVSEYYLKKR